jgi:hypothetical protein
MSLRSRHSHVVTSSLANSPPFASRIPASNLREAPTFRHHRVSLEGFAAEHSFCNRAAANALNPHARGKARGAAVAITTDECP